MNLIYYKNLSYYTKTKLAKYSELEKALGLAIAYENKKQLESNYFDVLEKTAPIFWKVSNTEQIRLEKMEEVANKLRFEARRDYANLLAYYINP